MKVTLDRIETNMYSHLEIPLSYIAMLARTLATSTLGSNGFAMARIRIRLRDLFGIRTDLPTRQAIHGLKT